MIKKRICCYEAVRTATDSDRDVEVVGDEELPYMEEIRVCRSIVELHRVILVPCHRWHGSSGEDQAA
jgi:hypothetical protein